MHYVTREKYKQFIIFVVALVSVMIEETHSQAACVGLSMEHTDNHMVNLADYKRDG